MKCSVFLMVTVTLKCSVFLMVLFSAPYGHCHSAVFSAPYGHCHSAPYRRSAVVMTDPGPRTASRPNDAAQPVTPAISTQCCTQHPTVNVNCHQTTAVMTPDLLLSQSKIIARLSQSQHYLHWHVCRPVNIYIMLCNVPLSGVRCNAADLLMILH